MNESPASHLHDSLDDPPICHACRFTNIPVKEYSEGGKTFDLCEICANTDIGNSKFYPSMSPGIDKILHTMGWIANHIMTEIKAAKVVETKSLKERRLPVENPNGITIPELQKWLNAFSDGEVWIGQNGLSNQVHSLYELNDGSVILGTNS